MTQTVPDHACGSEGRLWTVTQAGGERSDRHGDLSFSQHWYDVSVPVSDDASFLRRFAGRVENGRDGVTDPAMGLQSA